MNKESKIEKLKRLHRQEGILPKKYRGENGRTTVVLPSPIQKKDLSDYSYALDIDEKVVKMATKIAERMAVAMVRETLSINVNAIVDKICDQIVPSVAEKISNKIKLPAPEYLAERYINKEEIRKEIKDIVFEKPELAIDRSQGIEIKGDIGKKTTSKESTDDDLSALEDLL